MEELTTPAKAHPPSSNGFKFTPPKYTLGYFMIVITTAVTTSVVIISGSYSSWQADSGKIVFDK
jgi:hypothetical protein